MAKECKRCLLLQAAEEDTYRDIQAQIDKIAPEEKAEAELYDKRLAACRECDQLLSGVCMKCGCYVEFRAAFKAMKCPNVKNRKW